MKPETPSESVIEHIVRAERHLWKCVEIDILPVDVSESAGKALQALYPEQTPLLTEDFTDNETANQLFNELLEE